MLSIQTLPAAQRSSTVAFPPSAPRLGEAPRGSRDRAFHRAMSFGVLPFISVTKGAAQR